MTLREDLPSSPCSFEVRICPTEQLVFVASRTRSWKSLRVIASKLFCYHSTIKNYNRDLFHYLYLPTRGASLSVPFGDIIGS